MSALLTTTMPYMKVVIDTLKEKGIRNDHIVLVGGAPLNESFAEAIGADAYCRDAAVAVETAKALLARRQGSLQAEAVARACDSQGLSVGAAPLRGFVGPGIPVRRKIFACRPAYFGGVLSRDEKKP